MGCASSSDASESQRAQLLRSMVRRERAAQSLAQGFSAAAAQPGREGTQRNPLAPPPPPPQQQRHPSTARDATVAERAPSGSAAAATAAAWSTDYVFPTTPSQRPAASPPTLGVHGSGLRLRSVASSHIGLYVVEGESRMVSVDSSAVSGHQATPVTTANRSRRGGDDHATATPPATTFVLGVPTVDSDGDVDV